MVYKHPIAPFEKKFKQALESNIREELNTDTETKIQDFIERFRKIIHECDACVAGGFVLSAYSKKTFKSSDLDIYIPFKNVKKFFDFLTPSLNPPEYYNPLEIANGYPIFRRHVFACAYDDSFLRKNKIMWVITLPLRVTRINDFFNIDSFDIMVVADKILTESVVQNFDLTCSETWYNGVEVKSTENITDNMNCYLRQDYIPSLLNGNYFIYKRIKKYKKRGFEINFQLPNSLKNINYLFSSKSFSGKKTISNEKEWVVKKILTGIEELIYFGYRYDYNLRYENRIRLITSLTTLDDIGVFKKTMMSFGWEKMLDLKYELDFGLFCFLCLSRFHGHGPTELFTKLLKLAVGENIDDYMELNEDEEVLHRLGTVDFYKLVLDYDEGSFYNRKLFNEKSFSQKLTAMKQLNNPVAYNVVELENLPIKDILKNMAPIEENSKVFITPHKKAFVLTIPEFNQYRNDSAEWFYECNGDFIRGTNDKKIHFDADEKYVAIALGDLGFKVLVRYEELVHSADSTEKLFYIFPKKKFTHTISHNAAYHIGNWVSANHCQARSNYDVYKIEPISASSPSKRKYLTRRKTLSLKPKTKSKTNRTTLKKPSTL